uniref:Uncharacterized protein n=1 Tax=Oryza barthii TaxID=65489 RepID=A0A0D3GG54_9ORYZ
MSPAVEVRSAAGCGDIGGGGCHGGDGSTRTPTAEAQSVAGYGHAAGGIAWEDDSDGGAKSSLKY